MAEGPRINRLLALGGLCVDVLAPFWATRRAEETLIQNHPKGWRDIQKVQASVGVLDTQQGQNKDLPPSRSYVAGGSVKLMVFLAQLPSYWALGNCFLILLRDLV